MLFPMTIIIFLSTAGAQNVCQNVLDCRPGQFCGTNGICNDFSCATFYQFGPPQYTGHTRDDDPPPLNCVPYQAQEKETQGPYGVVYGCSKFVQGPIPSDRGIGLPFTTYCSSRPFDQVIFECYDLSDNTADLDAFEAHALGTGLDCPEELDERLPVFVYVHANSFFLVDAAGNSNAFQSYGPDPLYTQELVKSSTLTTIVSTLKSTSIVENTPSVTPPDAGAVSESPSYLVTIPPGDAASRLLSTPINSGLLLVSMVGFLIYL